MNKWIEFFGKQGLFADLSTVFVFIVGIVAALTIKKEMFPNVSFEVVTVATVYPGASAEEVERLISNKLEIELKEVDGIRRMTSVSIEGRSLVVLELDPDQTTVDEAKVDIQDVVDKVTNLPRDAEDPLVVAVESKQNPVIQVSISSDLEEEKIRRTAKFLEKRLETISGVAKVVIDGARDFEYRVEADPDKLRKYQLTLDDLIRALEVQNVNVPGGVIEGLGKGKDKAADLIVRTVGEFRDIEDVKSSVVRSNVYGRAIRVSDVAEVYPTFEKATKYQKTNGRSSMNLTVLKKESGDSIRVVDSVKAMMKELEGQVPEGIYVAYVNDSSYYIRRRLGVLSGNLGIGLVLVVLILTMVMPWRVALIAAIGIPFAFLGTVYLMDQIGISMNLITMMGLIIVVGMLVDDAIVVTENIVRHMEMGTPPVESAIKGTQEIWAPVTASVLTTIMAFVPMLVMTGIMGKFIRYIPTAVILALIISLYECYFILPHHLAAWVGPRILKKSKKSVFSPIRNFWDENITNFYVSVVERVVQSAKLRWGVSFGALAFVAVSVALSNIPFILFPKDGVEAFTIKAEAEVGTSLEKMRELMVPIEKAVAQIPKAEMDDFTTQVGVQSMGPGDPNTKRGGEVALMMVYLKPEIERERKASDIMESLRTSLGERPEFVKLSIEAISGGPPTGRALSVGVNGNEFDEILPAVQDIKKIASAIKGTSDIVDTFVQGKDEIQVVVDKAEAFAGGLTVASIGTTVRAAYEGVVATTIQKLDEEIDVRVTLPLRARSNEASLKNILVSNSAGAQIPLHRVADFKKAKTVSQYDHEWNSRQVRVYGNIDDKLNNATAVTEEIKSHLPDLRKKHPNVDFVFGGEFEDTEESMQSLGKTSIAALLGITFILILLFKNLLQPVLVLFTIPLGVSSVLWAFKAHGMPMSFLGAIGMVALAGVIVNNAIVFIDFVNSGRASGLDRYKSVVEAGRKRVRPVFLTTLTTVCGILPTAYGLGGLDQFVVPVAMALGWGMAGGSFLSVFVLPAYIGVHDDVMGFLVGIKNWIFPPSKVA